MLRDSVVYSVLSPEKIPALDMGEVLSIFNNSNHPQLTARGATAFLEAEILLDDCITKLHGLAGLLQEYPIRLNEYLLALNYLHSYIYIIQVTTELPKNARLLNYAKSVKAGS